VRVTGYETRQIAKGGERKTEEEKRQRHICYVGERRLLRVKGKKRGGGINRRSGAGQ
jgi:tRNA U34 2-thiouridine synthase MnmA/TrmU